jgi:hypothetical protein
MFNRIWPNGTIGWSDSSVDYIEPIPQDVDYIEPIPQDVNYFAKPRKIYSVNDLLQSTPPSVPGVYGWYFDELPPYVPKVGCVAIKTGFLPFRTKWWLLYIGQAENLKDRIVNYHIKGGHYAERTMSSLRLSLGCLLSKKLGMILCYPQGTFGEKEKELDKWLKEHARVAWVETKDIDTTERIAIENYRPPLNSKHNDRHPLRKPLSGLKKAFKEIATNLEQKPRKKDFKKAYKQFVKECKSLGIEK